MNWFKKIIMNWGLKIFAEKQTDWSYVEKYGDHQKQTFFINSSLPFFEGDIIYECTCGPDEIWGTGSTLTTKPCKECGEIKYAVVMGMTIAEGTGSRHMLVAPVKDAELEV